MLAPRSHFNELAKDGRLQHWRDAYENGYVRVAGQEEILKLIGRVIERHETRAEDQETEDLSQVAETDTKQGTTFDQASREATGARPYGRYLEDFEEGAIYKHWPAKTVTEADDHLFCLITMNHHPLHINDEYARQSQQGQNVVVGPLVYSLALGMTVGDISGKAIANLGTEELRHTAPGVPRRHALRRDRGARGRGLRVEARPRRGQGAHRRLQPAQRARRDLQPRRAGPRKRPE